jgi:hypothetical protein
MTRAPSFHILGSFSRVAGVPSARPAPHHRRLLAPIAPSHRDRVPDFDLSEANPALHSRRIFPSIRKSES